jgi:hypothetical protein
MHCVERGGKSAQKVGIEANEIVKKIEGEKR